MIVLYISEIIEYMNNFPVFKVKLVSFILSINIVELMYLLKVRKKSGCTGKHQETISDVNRRLPGL